jgi:hypothetical protein
VLDDVERRRFLVEPAREDPPVAPVVPPHVQLDERAGQLLALPRRRGLAGAKPNDGVFNPDRLARPHPQVAHDPVALVEQPDHGHALRHRRHPGLCAGQDLLVGLLGRLLLLIAFVAPAAGKQRRQHQCGSNGPPHVYSGVQA